ncbi:PREDICTED: DNA repair protein XRCC4-like [Poecilia mexicana]|uniref:X-ray repair complementing defective repair in Chinese hamster cells 4 n=1 Tax=Poecilia mexicana TaxID=48701 RepID=A0A3B3Z202_9TELE|nr:PREDICTED: DNA repair protein XRCC4-like [Poecilia mexicana]XP_014833316.1 PREDICTED: DNA repair protein XRCC4-like [Poecilia mexicana]
MNTSVREIHLSSQADFSYFLRVDWEGRGLGFGFKLLLTDGHKAWRGKVSEAVVNEEAEELEMAKEKYIQDLQQALTEPEPSASYCFTLKPHPPTSSHTVTLTYEKMQKDISFKLGSVSLDAVKEPAKAVREVLIHTLQQGNELQQHNHKLKEENQRLIQEHQNITEKLKHYAESIETLKAELYSRFVLLLNEKKTKIRSLQEAVTKLQETRNSDEQKNKDSAKSDRTAGHNSEDDEYEGSTDEELKEEQSAETSHPSSKDSATPSPLNLRDITDVAPCRKRRFRHLGPPELAVKKQNPEKKNGADSSASSNQLQTPQCSVDVTKAASAGTSEAEDLFDDF